MLLRPRVLLAAAFALAIAGTSAAFAEDTTADKSGTGLPVPRFVSLKSDQVNVRKGPSAEHGVNWVFHRAGLPVEITAEFEHWRRVRDSEGAEGWVFHSLLSGRRTALVQPWVKEQQAVALYAGRSEKDTVVAKLEPDVLASVLNCDGQWCRLSVDDYTGWMPQDRLWGVYRGETIQ